MAVVPEVTVAGPPPIPTVNLPPSFDSMLGSLAAAEQAIARVASDIKVMVDAQARASTDFSRAIDDNKKVMKSIEKAVEDSVRQQRVAFETAGPSGRTISEGAAPRSMAPSSAFEQRERDAYEQAQRDFQRAQRQPFSTMREQMFGSMAESLSARQEGFMVDPSGRVRTSGGQFVSGEDASRIQNLQRGADFFQTFAESGAQSAILKQFPQLAGALRFAGVAGAVIGGTRMAASQLEQQREAARGYQQALGVSNIEAQRQRASQAVFRTSMMGTMSGQMADRLFDDLTAQGLVGEERQEASRFAVSAFREFGMDTASSVALLRTASRRGVESFEELSSALRGVTEAAAASGISAQAARESFVSLYTSMSSTIGSAGAIAISQGLATTEAQLGGTFDIGFGGTFSEDQIRRMAAAEGVSYNEMVAALGDPNRASEFVRRRSERTREQLSTALTAQGVEAFGAGVEARGGSIEALSAADFQAIASDMLASGALPDVEQLRSQYSFLTGADASRMRPDELVAAILMEVGGTGQLDQVAANIESNIAERDITDIDMSGGRIAGTMEISSQLFGDYEDAFKQGINPFSSRAREARERSRLRGRYQRDVARRGGVGADPIVASLIAQSNRGDMFEVNVGGQRRVVDLQTLIEQFPDQIAAGTVSYATGANAGRSISQVFGVGSRELPQEVMDSIDLEGRADAGMPWEEHLAAMSREEGVIAGRVYVEPTPLLAEYLQFFSAGTVGQQAANNSVVPMSIE